MMRVVQERFCFGRESALSRLIVPGVSPSIFILEDQVRRPGDAKVWGETAIPPGLYKLELRTEGGFHQDYSDRFPEMHRGMVHLLDVPDFEWIQMHPGNTETDTAGCPLTGMTWQKAGPEDFEIPGGQATPAYKRVYPVIADGIEAVGCEWEVRHRGSPMSGEL